MKHRLKKIIFLTGDLLILHAALALTLFVRYRLIDGQQNLSSYWQGHWRYFFGVFIIFILVFYINSLYSLRQMAAIKNFTRRTFNSVIAASLLAALYFYAFPRADIAPKTNLAIFAAIALAAFLLWRRLAYWLASADAWQNNLAIIGNNEKTAALVASLDKKPALGYQIVQIISHAEELADLEKNIRAKNIRIIVLADDLGANEIISSSLFSLLRYRVTFISYTNFYEQINEEVPVESINQDWFLENLQEGEKNYFDFLKQSLDFIMAAVIFLLSLPFWPLIALMVKLSSSGPAIFTQERLGKNGRPFKLYKFRTMRVEGNDGTMTVVNDNRITAIGSFLRSTRLDEIPQLINIIKGEMSFIGPRPERPEFSAELEKQLPFYNTRLLVKPGLTGWDQVSGEYHSSSPIDTLKKLQHDLYYIKHRSPYLDATIALKTIATVLGREGR